MLSDRRRIFKIVSVTTVLILLITALGLGCLYIRAIEDEKAHLANLSILHVQHLETLKFSWLENEVLSQELLINHIQQIFELQNQHHFGKTGEVLLVRSQKEGMANFSAPHHVGKNSSHFQWDLFGNSGTQTFSDSHGDIILTAYEPLPGLPLGVVTKINLQEIQFPYLMMLGISWLLEIGIMLLACYMLVSKTSTKQNEEKIRTLIASAGEGIVTFDEYGTIETFNEAAEALFACRASEVIGMPFRNLFIPAEQNACDLFLLTYRPMGVKCISNTMKEFIAQRRNGTVFTVTLTLIEAPIWGHRLFTALLRNVTEQKLAERRLAAQYAIARVLADCTTIQQATPEILRAVCESLDWQLGVLWQVETGTQSLHCVEIWRDSPDRFSEFVTVTQGMSFSKGIGLPGRVWETGKPIWIPDSVKDSNFPRAPMAAKSGLHAAFAFPIKLGEAIHGVMEFFSREIQEPDEALLHQLLSVGSQIGQFMQRKETEMALRESEERTRLILDTALDAVVTLDENANIIGWNSMAERMFGWSRQEIVGQPVVSTIIPQKYRYAHLQGIKRYLTSEISEILNKRIELAGLHRDGHEFPLEIAITAVRSKGGTIFSGFLRDLTERRRTEEALLKSEEQRRQAQKMEAMGTLAGGIAHDFNNILSAIIGYTELAMAQIGTGSSVVPRLQEVLRAGYRAKQLVRQILTFSRQDESGKKAIYLQPIVEEALNLLRASLPSTITLEAELQTDSTPVLADATQIHQVVMNLGANAEYAMRKTGGRLVVKLHNVEVDGTMASFVQGLHKGSYIQLKVSDSGQGMSPSVKKRIFDPFFTTKEVGEGTGMGLSVIHGIVTSHGGAIGVDSQEGMGTIFTIYFPCTSIPVVGQELSSMTPPYCGKGTVMFVDDEISIVKWAKDMLEELGYMVVVFTNGLDALRAFRQDPKLFDVIVTDQTMPGMTGELLARQVMSICPGFPVILCSGFSYTMTEEKALAMGLRAYLTKPVLMNDMAQALRIALDRSVPH